MRKTPLFYLSTFLKDAEIEIESKENALMIKNALAIKGDVFEQIYK